MMDNFSLKYKIWHPVKELYFKDNPRLNSWSTKGTAFQQRQSSVEYAYKYTSTEDYFELEVHTFIDDKLYKSEKMCMLLSDAHANREIERMDPVEVVSLRKSGKLDFLKPKIIRKGKNKGKNKHARETLDIAIKP